MSAPPPPPGASMPDVRQPLTVQGRGLLAINIVFLILPLIAIAGRIWSRYLKKLHLGTDDYLIISAGLVWIAQVSYNFWCLPQSAVGYPIQAASPLSIVIILQQLAVSQFLYAIVFSLTRLSICFLFLRIFVQRWLHITVYVAIAIQIAWALFVIFGQVGLCTPFEANWNPMIPGAHCNNDARLPIYVANAIWTIVYDFCLICVPQPVIWRLQMPTTTRALLSCIFALGLIDVVISIVRIIFIVKLDLTNLTESDYLPQVWTILEPAIAIVVACLPTVRPALARIFPCALSLTRSVRPPGPSNDSDNKRSTGNSHASSSYDSKSALRSKKFGGMGTWHELDEESSAGGGVELVSSPHRVQHSATAASTFAPDQRDAPIGVATSDTSIHVTRDVWVESER